MKIKLTIGVVLSGLTAFPATAQSPVSGDWAGYYAGAFVGYSFGTANMTDANGTSTDDYDIDGYGGGVVLGWNMQNQQVVYGVEFDLGFAGTDGSSDTNCSAGCVTEVSTLASLRGRLGYASGPFLPYATLGVAGAKIDGDVAGTFQNEDFVYGWAGGIGLDYAASDTISIRGEAIYFDFDPLDIPAIVDVEDEVDFYSVRLGVNYHF